MNWSTVATKSPKKVVEKGSEPVRSHMGRSVTVFKAERQPFKADMYSPLRSLTESESTSVQIRDPIQSPHYATPLDWSTSTDVTIANACQALLNKLKEDLPGVQDFRLSLDFQKNEVRLKIPPLVWYDQTLAQRLQDPEKIRTALKWVESVKSTHANMDLYDPRAQFVKVTAQDFCYRGVECPYWLGNKSNLTCSRTHSWQTCAELVQQRDEQYVPCNFQIPGELVFQERHDQRFVLFGRQDDIKSRDILFVPKPTATCVIRYDEGKFANTIACHPNETWRGHYENEAFVVSPDTWKFVKTMTQSLLEASQLTNVIDLLEEVAFNFGLWETKISRDRLALECHAHGHIVLTHEGQKALVRHPIYHDVLSGKHAPPFPYDHEDANILEGTRISGDRFNLMAAKMDNQDAKMDNQVAKIDALSAKVEQLGNQIAKQGDILQQILAKLPERS
ncbi:hypothetical protein DFS34DRAFT_425085 [Phlyctochytrium arcticum]|nr:hypothetical protein DFS34DRAFT_425085 [Phlyctochytrium arcticum]